MKLNIIVYKTVSRVACACISLSAVTDVLLAVNPLLPLDEYIPDVEARVFTNAKGEQRLYLYGSHDEYPPTGWCSWQYRVYSAPLDNLEKWTDHGVSFASRAGEGYRWEGKDSDGISWSDGRLFAPDVICFKGKYWLVSCLDNGGLGMSVSDNPEGPFSPATQVVYDKSPSGEVAKLPSIDPALYAEGDTLYLVWGQMKGWGEGLVGVVLQKDEKGIYSVAQRESKRFLFGTAQEPDKGFGFYEGPSLRKVNNKYYLLYPSNKTPNVQHTMSYAVADKPLGPYKFGGNILNNDGIDKENGNNHGSFCEVNGKWYLFYHRGYNGNCSRKVSVEPLTFRDDGSIDPVTITNHGFGPAPSAYGKIEAAWATRVRMPGFKAGCHLHETAKDKHPLVNITEGNCVEYRDFDFGNENKSLSFVAQVLPLAGGTVELVLDDPEQEVIGTLVIPSSSDKKEVTLETTIKPVKGVRTLYLRFKAPHKEKIGELFSFAFQK